MQIRMLRLAARLPALVLAGLTASLGSACGTEVIYTEGAGTAAGSSTGSGTGSTTGTGTGAGGTSTTGGSGAGSTTATGGGDPITDCISAVSGDPCGSPGSYCNYYDASTGETCDSFCDESFRWQKDCYVEPSYCYQPDACRQQTPTDGAACAAAPGCDIYDCEYVGACGGNGFVYATCDQGRWFVFDDCYCSEPESLCPAQPPVDGTACVSTTQCREYDCFYDCGDGRTRQTYCDGGRWYDSGCF